MHFIDNVCASSIPIKECFSKKKKERKKRKRKRKKERKKERRKKEERKKKKERKKGRLNINMGFFLQYTTKGNIRQVTRHLKNSVDFTDVKSGVTPDAIFEYLWVNKICAAHIQTEQIRFQSTWEVWSTLWLPYDRNLGSLEQTWGWVMILWCFWMLGCSFNSCWKIMKTNMSTRTSLAE